MQRGITNNIQNEQNIIANNGHQLPPALEIIQINNNQDFRKINTIVFLDRYRNLGFNQCNICLKEFKAGDRVKRFPRECDHIFHIKCLEIWLKIEASCPNCKKDYLCHKYTNPSCGYREDPEEYSILQNW